MLKQALNFGVVGESLLRKREHLRPDGVEILPLATLGCALRDCHIGPKDVALEADQYFDSSVSVPNSISNPGLEPTLFSVWSYAFAAEDSGEPSCEIRALFFAGGKNRKSPDCFARRVFCRLRCYSKDFDPLGVAENRLDGNGSFVELQPVRRGPANKQAAEEEVFFH